MGSRKLAAGFSWTWQALGRPKRRGAREAATPHPRHFHLIEQPIEGAWFSGAGRPSAIARIASSKLPARVRRRRRGAALVQPAAIFELELPVEAEEVRRADRAIGARDLLRLIVQIGKREAVLFGELAHLGKGILRIACRVVR